MDESTAMNRGNVPGNERSPLELVREGMKVFDRNGKEIGKVDMVRMSGVSNKASSRGLGSTTTTTSSDAALPSDTVVDDVASAFANDHLPEELRERLMQKGFFRVDTKGLFASDRYVLPDQIGTVSNDEVHLKASRDELIKR